MPTQLIGTGSSNAADPQEAFRLACIDVKNQVQAIPPDMVILFATPSHMTPEGIMTLHKILSPKRLIGAVTPGVLVNDQMLPRGIAILAIANSTMRWGTASIEPIGLLSAREAGQTLARALLSNFSEGQRNLALYFYNGLRANGSLFCSGMRETLGMALPLTGAVGLDGPRLLSSQVVYQDRILNDGATALLIGGTHAIGIASRHSWQPLGKPRIVDLADGHIIRTIDKKPAVQLYREYFHAQGNTSDELRLNEIRLLYPLGIGTGRPKEYLIRNPIDILPDGSIVCQGDVPTGSRVHLMISNKDASRQSAHDAALDIRDQLFGRVPAFVLVFESYVRQRIQNKSAAHDLAAIRDVLGTKVPILGMYTLGEIGPPHSLKNVSATQMLNGSLMIMAIA